MEICVKNIQSLARFSLEKVFEYVTILLRNKNRKLGYEKNLRLRGRISIFLSKKGN
jgi:hypothetical protein